MIQETNRKCAVALLVLIGSAFGLTQGCKKKPVREAVPPDTTQTGEPQSTPEQTTSAAETLKALDAVEQAWARTHSFSATVQIFVDQAIGRPGSTSGDGTYDLLKEGDKTKIRFYMANALRIDIAIEHSDLRTAEFLYWVTDGTVLYQSTHQAKKYYVVNKTWYEDKDILHVGGPPLMYTLRSERRLESVEDEELDGRAVVVFKAVPPDGDWFELHYFDKETGIRLKLVEFDSGSDSDSVKKFELTLTELNMNVEFEPDHFTFEIPEHATLVDKTKDCSVDGDCDDSNSCTNDVCVSGACNYTNSTGPCDDGNLCTTNDVCSVRVCAGTAVDCGSTQRCDPADGLCKD